MTVSEVGRLGGLARRPDQVALGSLAVDCVMVLAKLTAGLLTGSLGLLSEAAHSGLDLVASLLAFLAVRTARKPADIEHPFGHGRVENLAAFTEGIVLLITAAGIAYEGVRRLLGTPHHVDAAFYAIALLVITIVVEVVRATVLRRVADASGSAALAASSQNRLADIFSSSGVLIGLVGVRAGYQSADAVAALIVAAVIARAAGRLVWRSGDILMDRAPSGVEAALRRTIAAVRGVRDVRAVRVRRSGNLLIGDATVSTRRMLSVEAAQSLKDDVRRAVSREHPEVDLTLAIEADVQAANLVERVHATAARQDGIRDLHNVTVEREEDGRLHLSMHAKLPGDLSLDAATSASAHLERSLRKEFPGVARVDIHLEPLEPEVVRGADVTARREDLARRVRALVESHPGVVRCRDVELSARGDRLVAHVVAEMPGGIPLEEAHAVETDIEERVRRALPELFEVIARVTA